MAYGFLYAILSSIALNQLNLMYVSFRIGGNKINNILAYFFLILVIQGINQKVFMQKYLHIMDLCGIEYVSLFMCLSLSTCMAVLFCHAITCK